MHPNEGMGYRVPLSLTIISGVFLALGAVLAIAVAVDIFLRKAWRSMMLVMVPVYIINATYLGPFSLWVYFRFGRPAKGQTTPSCHEPKQTAPSCHVPKPEESHSKALSTTNSGDGTDPEDSNSDKAPSHPCHTKSNAISESAHGCSSQKTENKTDCHNEKQDGGESGHACHSNTPTPAAEHARDSKTPSPAEEHACHAASAGRPKWATVLVGVFHCGAGCVLGDVVGELVVWGSGATINGEMLWVELLVDYAFALFFGIFFQYFSIAPMSGQWGPMTVVRAAKADIISLTSFEIGAFGWMVAFQAGIFDYRLDMMTWAYWWLMQVGMCLGVLTAYPVNWWLLSAKIKEPCC